MLLSDFPVVTQGNPIQNFHLGDPVPSQGEDSEGNESQAVRRKIERGDLVWAQLGEDRLLWGGQSTGHHWAELIT